VTGFFYALDTYIRRHLYLMLAMILVLYFVLGLAYLAVTPVFEKPDENWHFAYVAYILDHRGLPPLDEDVAANPAEQIAGHPPLYYALSSGLLKLTGLEGVRPDIAPNPFWAVPVPGTVNDNKNHFIHPAHELTRTENRSFYLLRLFSLLIGAGAVIGAYAIASALRTPIWLWLAAAAGVALTPQYLYIATSVSNDALVASLSAFAMFTLLLAIRPRARWRLWILFGVLAGLATLTKTSAVTLVGVGMVGGAAAAWRDRSWKTGIASISSIAIALAVIVGWWYVRNGLLFHDPLGTNIHHLKMARETPLTLLQTLGEWRPVERSFWAAFGWGNALFPANYYLPFRIAEMAAIVGLGLLIFVDRKRSYAGRLGFWLLLMLVAGGLLGLGVWTMTIQGSLGRLLFSVLAPLMVLMMVGLARIHRAVTLIFLFWLAVMALLSPVIISRAYLPQSSRDVAENVADFQGPIIQFGDVARLISYDIQPDRVWPYQHVSVTLCWEALRRTETDYALFIQIVGPEDSAIGYRASFPGRGNALTRFWTPGDVICGDYQVDIKGDAPGPMVYPVVVWMYSIEKDERLIATIDGKAVQPAIIGHVKVYGKADVIAPDTGPAYEFADNVTLQAYEWTDASPGTVAPVTLYWQATGPISYPYTVFIHLVDAAGNIVAQTDAQPHNDLGEYPMDWWDSGETVRDVHLLSIPPMASPGAYTLRAGLYRLDTMARVPLISGGDSAELGDLTICAARSPGCPDDLAAPAP
jgi:hypothetical protein